MLPGVILDLHDTVVTAGSLLAWMEEAGVDLREQQAVEPVLATVWERAARRHPDALWDLDPQTHRRVFLEVLTTEAGCPGAAAEQLYALMPRQWQPVPGARELLDTLRAGGVRTALLSNIGLDPRPRLAELELLDLFDHVVLSFEVGLVKPDPRIFELTAARMSLPCPDCVMLGDSPVTDGAAARVGMPTVLVPFPDGRPDLRRLLGLLTTR